MRMMGKVCTRCEINKSTQDFSIRRTSKDGLCSWCKVCSSEYVKIIYRRKHPKKEKVIPEFKVCSKCAVRKHINDFKTEKRVIGGKGPACKLCDSAYKRKQHAQNPEKYKEYYYNKRKRNKDDWLKFLIDMYGNDPECQLCRKNLSWRAKGKTNDGDTVNFDHRTQESLVVKTVPSSWLEQHICNITNQEKWLSFNFGILCNICNGRLPTLDRKQWLEQALSYVEACEWASS